MNEPDPCQSIRAEIDAIQQDIANLLQDLEDGGAPIGTEKRIHLLQIELQQLHRRLKRCQEDPGPPTGPPTGPAMDPRDNFKNSDSVRVTEISYDLITPPGSGAQDGPKSRINLCVTKAQGQMNLILNTKTDLGADFNLDIELSAELPLPTGLLPLVTWNVDEMVNIRLGPATTLKRITGSLTASFQEIIPRSMGFACDNTSPRAAGVSFQTVGTDNHLYLYVDTPLLGDWKLLNIRLTGGTAAESV